MISMTKALPKLLLVGMLFLSACKGAPQTPTPTQPDPAAVITAAAATAQARLTQQAVNVATPTQTVPSPTSLSVTPVITPTLPVTSTVSPLPSPLAGGVDKMEFVMDVTVSDGTVFRPGEAFVKTWRLKNTGTSTWTTAYNLVFISGHQMGGPAAAPLQNDVPPGQTVDVSVNLVAPTSPGNYIGFWMLRNSSQRNFGLGANSDQPFYVEINVLASGGTPVPTSPSTSGGKVVAFASLSVDTEEFEGSCPHTFNFIAKFALNKAVTVSYRLEAETGFPITLPPPFTGGLDPGTYTLNYALEFSASVKGTARLHITSPEDVVSNTINFTLKCK